MSVLSHTSWGDTRPATGLQSDEEEAEAARLRAALQATLARLTASKEKAVSLRLEVTALQREAEGVAKLPDGSATASSASSSSRAGCIIVKRGVLAGPAGAAKESEDKELLQLRRDVAWLDKTAKRLYPLAEVSYEQDDALQSHLVRASQRLAASSPPRRDAGVRPLQQQQQPGAAEEAWRSRTMQASSLPPSAVTSYGLPNGRHSGAAIAVDQAVTGGEQQQQQQQQSQAHAPQAPLRRSVSPANRSASGLVARGVAEPLQVPYRRAVSPIGRSASGSSISQPAQAGAAGSCSMSSAGMPPVVPLQRPQTPPRAPTPSRAAYMMPAYASSALAPVQRLGTGSRSGTPTRASSASVPQLALHVQPLRQLQGQPRVFVSSAMGTAAATAAASANAAAAVASSSKPATAPPRTKRGASQADTILDDLPLAAFFDGARVSGTGSKLLPGDKCEAALSTSTACSSLQSVPSFSSDAAANGVAADAHRGDIMSICLRSPDIAKQPREPSPSSGLEQRAAGQTDVRAFPPPRLVSSSRHGEQQVASQPLTNAAENGHVSFVRSTACARTQYTPTFMVRESMVDIATEANGR
eukprot:TRINITY_DN9902_c0_g1_i1.p1 TRINITY_DN9902_c0_g1~~TRINITY_DN9902_c0_g1_i1.p1  ORF type:complete len:585 (-),score=130.20 TRINITY_DN9902_c0_g1_i1:57-1811(-)